MVYAQNSVLEIIIVKGGGHFLIFGILSRFGLLIIGVVFLLDLALKSLPARIKSSFMGLSKAETGLLFFIFIVIQNYDTFISNFALFLRFHIRNLLLNSITRLEFSSFNIFFNLFSIFIDFFTQLCFHIVIQGLIVDIKENFVHILIIWAGNFICEKALVELDVFKWVFVLVM